MSCFLHDGLSNLFFDFVFLEFFCMKKSEKDVAFFFSYDKFGDPLVSNSFEKEKFDLLSVLAFALYPGGRPLNPYN